MKRYSSRRTRTKLEIAGLIREKEVFFAKKLLGLVEGGNVQTIDALSAKIPQLTTDVAVCEYCEEKFDRTDDDAVCKPMCKVHDWDQWERSERLRAYDAFDFSGKCQFCSDGVFGGSFANYNSPPGYYSVVKRMYS